MLHHVPSVAQQDALFAEACRVLRPGGAFRGVDSDLSIGFRLLHLGDTMVVLDPATLPDRLRRAGFAVDTVAHRPRREISFTARRPPAS
ncbi:class I SAM-dependent methyltransferase [Actinocatenispora comari]|nr:class I SAM-dependent methyltransferase [Actinocatenispora comari]